MRNSKWFELNIFDEKADVSDLPVTSLNPQVLESLDFSQKYLLNSPFFKKLSVAYKKWEQVINENNSALLKMFSARGEREFLTGLNPFKQGKYWQMLQYIDAVNPIRSEEFLDREDYQNDLFMNGDKELLQIGWDLAINSALLCDLMPQKSANGNKGSVYLLENVVWDTNSMFYPSVTNEFQKRVTNEAFWQCLCDLHNNNEYNVLEAILTKSFSELETNCAKDNIIRWNGPHRKTPLELTNNALVIGYSGPESFMGISPRAVENYGRFLKQVYKSFSHEDNQSLLPFMRMYVEAVNCIDEDGINYFMNDEKKEKLLDLNFVRDNLKLQTNEVCLC